MNRPDDLQQEFEELDVLRARLEGLSAHFDYLQRSRSVRLRALWHVLRSLLPTPSRRKRVLLAYEGVAPFPSAGGTLERPSIDERAEPLGAYFDASYYCARNPDIERAGIDPLAHYIGSGAAENRDAHPLFAPAWYVQRYREAAAFPGGAIRHYVAIGSRERFDPHPAFHARAYAQATGCRGDALAHYLANGARGGPEPHPLFDGARYRALAGDTLRAPLAEYLFCAATNDRPHPLFDPTFYRTHSPDVGTSMHPFVHYLWMGSAEGRAPNAWFDPAWYRATYVDVARNDLEPLSHFAVHGWREGRDPSPAFSTRWYSAAHMGGRSDINPLVWHIETGLASMLRTTPLSDPSSYRSTGSAPLMPEAPRPVDVLIPVFRSVSVTKRCVESVLRSDLPAGTRVIVIDDASPEPDVAKYVAGLAGPRLFAYANERNVGFVATVNRGLALSAGRDLVLLNSDTVVAGDWLGRLQSRAYRGRIATVTPLSNNATICSFPLIGQSNWCDADDVPLLHCAAVVANGERSIELPTGVGFCMFVRRDAVDDVGTFDEARFGRGYGEEVDFCRRAAKRNWLNVLAPDVFVFHHGEVSFEERTGPAKERAAAVVRTLYPDYEGLVSDHVRLDPARGARMALAMELVKKRGLPVLLFITHALGGGIEKHVSELALSLGDRATVLELSPSGGNAVRLEAAAPWHYVPSIEFATPMQDNELVDVIRAFGVERVHVHSVVGFRLDVASLLRALGLPFDFTVHDYYSVCPQITLSDPGGTYCGEPDEAGCAACISARPTVPFVDITTWRDDHAWLLRDADRVIAPSHDVRERMRRYHPDIDISVVPHAL